MGDPFYERIWRATGKSLGAEMPDNGMTWWRSMLGGLRLLGITALVSILLFADGLIPIVGQTLVPRALRRRRDHASGRRRRDDAGP